MEMPASVCHAVWVRPVDGVAATIDWDESRVNTGRGR